MKQQNLIADGILYAGVADHESDLFESQYLIPAGITYNSYVILDEQTVVMDTADARKSDEWLATVRTALDGRVPDYLVVLHVEPDHSGSIARLLSEFPDMRIVGNAKTFMFLQQFYDIDLSDRKVEVKEGATLSLGRHTLQFFTAAMVHWPEVMVAYEQLTHTLFTADAFGTFGVGDVAETWDDEARRYFINIVGKYGMQTQSLLKKAAALEISNICPLHGPALTENIERFVHLYNVWSSYQPEEKGVAVTYASIHGNTAAAAKEAAKLIEAKGLPVAIYDLARCDMAAAIADAFRYDRILLAAASYDASVFPPMEKFLAHLKNKNYQGRTVGILENGTWGPTAAKTMKAVLETMKNITIVEPVVTIKSRLTDATRPALQQLIDALTA